MPLMDSVLEKYDISSYITIIADNHLSEYIGDSDQRVKFLTRFTGSNGVAIVCSRNILFTDSRYYLQAQKELKNFEMGKLREMDIAEYLRKYSSGPRVGLNPRLFSYTFVDKLRENLDKKNLKLVLIDEDLVDCIWETKPKRTFNKIFSIESLLISDYYMYLKKHFGLSIDVKDFMIDKSLKESSLVVDMTYEEKLTEVRKHFNDSDVLVIAELDTIAWLFNLRGTDIEYNPVFYSYAVITKDTASLFVNADLKLDKCNIYRYDEFEEHLNEIKEKKVLISGTCNAFIASKIDNFETTDKIRKMQSIKSPSQLEGFNLAYIFDGYALTTLFQWLEENAGSGITEKDVSNMLHKVKKEFKCYVNPSFETICGAGSNSSIIHYSAGKEKIRRNEILLLDCGSQYLFGTTDTTRTLYFGEAPDNIRRDYTMVLKAQIQPFKNTYPLNMSGEILDALSRIPLWKDKTDYGHAFGHGVGHFLNVHENPPTLAMRYTCKLDYNQVFSLEPGIYKDKEYGIRLENLGYTKDVGDGYFQIQNLTYVPYQLNLIEVSMLDDDELSYLNNMSKQIRRILGPLLKGEPGYKYLVMNTIELKREKNK